MNLLCAFIGPILEGIFSIPYNLFSALGLSDLATLVSNLVGTIVGLLGCTT